MAYWDVIVVGLGGVGSSAVYHLAAAGHRVLGLDQYPPAHDRGSSHGQTRIIRQAYFEHPSYVPLLRRAYELWGELEKACDQRLFHRTGVVEIGPADGIVVPGVLHAAREHGLDVETLCMSEVSRRWPGLTGRSSHVAVLERDAGFLRVEECVRCHLRQAAAHSATLRHNVGVTGWRIDGSGVEVETDSGTERSGRIVFACGPWSGQVLGEIGMTLKVKRKYQYWYSPAREGYGESDGFPCFFHETRDGFFYGFPSLGDEGVKVARHSGGQLVECPSDVHPACESDRRQIENYLRQNLPGVGDSLCKWRGCYYTLTPDEHFIVDRHPEHEQVVVVAGLSGHGFKFTSVLGELATQLTETGTTNLDTSLLRANRLST